MLRLKSYIHNTLKSICLSRRPQTSVLSTQHFRIIALLLIPCTLYLIPVMLPVANAKTITLGWDCNSEPDLEGYVIYRNTNAPGPPYNYSDTLPEDEFADPLHPKAKLTGLKKGKEYYIALTAYNTEGVESSFSNDVCVEVVNGIAELCSASSTPSPSTSLNSGGDSGGGGGGGVCFISSASDKPESFTQLVVKPAIRNQVLAFLFLLLVLITVIKLRCNKPN